MYPISSNDVLKSHFPRRICRHVLQSGGQVKGAVMQQATAGGFMPTFNKMSGIQGWLNAVFLFVNVDCEDKFVILFEFGFF